MVSGLRINFICPAGVLSGGGRVLAIYAKRLAQRGHAVSVIIPKPDQPSLPGRLRSLIKQPLFSPKENERSFFFDGNYVIRRLNHGSPITDRDVPDGDVVIATWWQTAEWVRDLSRLKGVKIHFMQDYEIWGGDFDRVNAAIALKIPKIIISPWLQDLLFRHFDQVPLAHVPNSVETDKFWGEPRSKQATATVGFTYTSAWSKGADVVISAINRARLYIPELRAVGFGWHAPSQGVLPARTNFYRHATGERLREIYTSCDAWLFGTRIEGFGLPILEAMACRTPVIATPAGAAPRLLNDGGGVLVPMEDYGAMADAIVRLIGLPDAQWRSISNSAYKTAISYSWDDATDLFEKAIATALTSNL